MSLGVWQPEVKNRNGRRGIQKQSALGESTYQVHTRPRALPITTNK